MQKGNLVVEMFSSDDFNLEGIEEISVPSTLINMRCKSPFRNTNNIIIESKDVEGVEGLCVRLTKDNDNYNPQVKNDPKNKKFFTVARVELKTVGSTLIKAQESMRDDRIFRVSYHSA